MVSRGGQRTHGQSDRMRAPGSIGPGTTPGRVLKGTRMAGRMGNDRITLKALEVVQADPERNLLVVKGSIPGPNGGLVMIRKGAQQMALAARSSATGTPQQRRLKGERGNENALRECIQSGRPGRP